MAKKFYAQKDALGFPIPGTMMSNEIVPADLVEIPTSTTVSYKAHPEKLRYFVRRDKNICVAQYHFHSASFLLPTKFLRFQKGEDSS